MIISFISFSFSLYLCIPYHRSTLQRCNPHVPHSGLDRAQRCRPHPKQKVEHLCTHCSPGTNGTWFYWEMRGYRLGYERNTVHIYTMLVNWDFTDIKHV